VEKENLSPFLMIEETNLEKAGLKILKTAGSFGLKI